MPPRRKPTADKKRDGTYRPDRANLAEPVPVAGAPPEPDWLSVDAREEWRRLVPLLEAQKTLARADLGVMAAYCEMVAEIRGLTELLNAGRQFLVGDDDDPGRGARKYPIAKERREAIARMQGLAAQLGLSGADRAKVSTIADAQEDEASKLEREAREARQQRRREAREQVM